MVHTKSQLNLDEIKEILPHREPILMIDRVDCASEERLIAFKLLSKESNLFDGHFPGKSVLPGIYLVEAMAQASLILYAYNFEIEDLFFLAKEKTKFLSPVYPDSELRIEVEKFKYLKEQGISRAKVFVGDELCAESELAFAVAN